MSYLFTGSSLNANIATSLSTQIVIEVDNQRVGAIQSFNPTQNRAIKGIGEVGTDGFIEKVPNSQTNITVSVNRIAFDLLRLPQAFSRAFYNIHAQRVPFDIKVYDVSGVPASNATADGEIASASNTTGIVTQVYEGCWFANLSTQYQSDNYIISETATIEVTNVKTITPVNPAAFGQRSYIPNGDPYEVTADHKRVGSLDAVGLAQVLNKPLK